jgi:hypothetical protein
MLPSKIECTVITQICDPDGRYIAIEVNIDENIIWVINCYAPNDPVEQIKWLDKIQPIIDRAGGSNLIIGGDINDYFNPILDKYNAKINATDSEYIKAWKVICSDLNLTDIWRTLNPNTRRYTWRQGKSADTLKQSRLDYWIISTHMIYDLNKVDIKPGFRSDHSLIEIYFQGHQDQDRGPSFWHFNASLLKNKDYTDYMNNRIEEILEKHKDIDNLGLKWDVVKMEIRSSTICFSKNLAKKNRDNMKIVIEENIRLSKLIDNNPDEETLRKFNSTKLEIEYYNNEKSNGIMLRSKADWAEHGEKNTKFFLNLEKRNYKTKCITKLINEEEITINDKDEILNYEAKYYKKLYTEPKTPEQENEINLPNTFNDENTPKLNEIDKQMCENNISLDEIGIALKELKNGKSPGNDGFTTDFYKFFWKKIRKEVLNSLVYAHQIGELSTE